MHPLLEKARLYGIVDLGYVSPESISTATRALIAGGADILQLRAKNTPLELTEALAREIQPLCKDASIPFILNDHCELAAKLKVDGLHIGQDDGSLAEARELVGNSMIVGRSTHSLAQAKQALKDGFDYIGYGPLFPTPTKQGRPGIGLEELKDMQSLIGSQLPAFCIGGITRENLQSIVSAGARRAVIVSDLLTSQDIAQATQSTKLILNQTTLTN